MARNLIFSFLALLGLLSYVQAAGWTLDASCSNAAGEIRASLERAFNMAGIVTNQLGRTPDVNPDVLRVYRYLFKDETDGRFNLPNTLYVNAKVQAVFNSIYGMRGEVLKDINDPSTVIIYCDFSRFGPVSKDRTMHDNDLNIDITNSATDLKIWQNCKTSNPLVAQGGYIMAYTINDKRPWEVKASQIQICPWYIDYSFKRKFDESKGYKMKAGISKFLTMLTKPWRDTAIDAFADFSVTMLHELSHTREAGEIGLGGQVTLDRLKYGWKKITANTATGHANADNYAYFGLALEMMSASPGAQTVAADGSLSDRLTALTRRLVKPWLWFA